MIFRRGLFLCALVFSQWLYGADYVSHKQQGQSLIVTTTEGLVTLTAFSDDAIEVLYHREGETLLPSFALQGLPLNTRVSTRLNEGALQFGTSRLVAIIEKSPFRIQYAYNEADLLKEEVGFFQHDALKGFRFHLQEDEKLMGGGQRVLGMNRRGHRLPLYNRAHYGYGTHSEQMYFSLSAVMSSEKYALLFDNSAKAVLDIGKSNKDILQYETHTGRMAYIVVAGDDYKHLVSNVTEVTGRQPLPPRWALGNFASRFGYKSEQQTRDVVSRFVQQDFPLDAVVLDLFWFGKDIKGHMGNLDWDRDTFPTAEKMISDFAAQGVNTVLITEPFVLTTSKRWDDAVKKDALAMDLSGKPKRFDFYFGNTGLIDVFHTAGKAWFADIYKHLFEQGVAGWWGDLGEPEVHPADTLHRLNGQIWSADAIHNAYGHEWAKLVYETQKALAPNSRPMLMMRAGFLGSQRYGMIPWTGDVSRAWDGLKPQVELSLQMGMFGLAYTHSDLGGFAGGESFDRELYIRWLQYGTFQPVYRPHAQDAIAPEPVFHDEITQSVVRDFVKLRYRMLPYNYSLSIENAMTGVPMMRPMMFEAEDDIWFDIANQYMWGDALLVKPVTEAGTTETDVLLPKGVWINLWSDDVLQGGQSVVVETPLNQIPVLVKAGAFLPMTENMQSTREYTGGSLTLHYYPDESVAHSSYTLYEDDGKSADSLDKGHMRILKMVATGHENRLVISVSEKGDYHGAPKSRDVTLVLHNQPEPEQVTLDGVVIEQSNKAGTAGWYINDLGHVCITATLPEKSQIQIELLN